MAIEGLKCNVLDIFQSDIFQNNIKDEWISSCREFRLRVDARIEQKHLYEKDCSKKKFVYTDKISELQQEISTAKSDIDSVILQQKITDKKISNMIKLQEDVKDELEKAKARREALLLEMVDIQQEVEERKKKKISQWDAIKRACLKYKVHLDIHMNLQEDKNCQFIKISFFTNNEDAKNKYFVQLSYSDNHWTVEQIEPRIKKEHFNKLSIRKDSSEHSRISDITLFLYQVRSIFLKHYMKT
ncbi:hypothetical protein ALC53_00772 [Atta colombica]|uniref:Kinetochore protein SPC25 n=1 Tax=Atta colombica TaxID=520822 RepID=A0A195BUQ9_9HYME|nr:PREDICTED: uncharacterized protein LOC108689882 [Atta colombica]KYM92317.1 hypothetical protein ALC53_00772 [Atta colombica]